MKSELLKRREMLERCITTGALIAGVPMSQSRLLALWEETEAQAHRPTPQNAMGPFFKKGAPNTPDLRAPGDPGVSLQVSGRVRNTRGDLLPDARLEVWQADHAGHYDLKGYHYRARLALPSNAEYKIETVMPGHYPDRVAQHVHFMVSAPGHKTLVTQMYFATDPVFGGDPAKNYHKDPLLDTPDLILPVTLFEQTGAVHAAVSFEICLERA